MTTNMCTGPLCDWDFAGSFVFGQRFIHKCMSSYQVLLRNHFFFTNDFVYIFTNQMPLRQYRSFNTPSYFECEVTGTIN